MEIFGLSWWIITAVVFIAAVVRGAVGFAFALFLSPFLLLFVTPKQVVVTDITLSLASTLFNIFIMHRLFANNIRIKIFIPIIIGLLVGMPFGAYVLDIINIITFKIFIGIIIIVFAIALLFGVSFSFNKNFVTSGFVGILGGFLATATSLGGPPVVLFLHGQQYSKEVIYCNQVIIWLFMFIFSLITLLIVNVINMQMIYESVSFIPPLLLGMIVGMRTFLALNTVFFRNFTIIIIILSGLMAIISGIQDFH